MVWNSSWDRKSHETILKTYSNNGYRDLEYFPIIIGSNFLLLKLIASVDFIIDEEVIYEWATFLTLIPKII